MDENTFMYFPSIPQNSFISLLGNLFGNNKISFDEREAWTNQHLNEIYDSAMHPLSGKRFWTKAEEPFQVCA